MNRQLGSAASAGMVGALFVSAAAGPLLWTAAVHVAVVVSLTALVGMTVALHVVHRAVDGLQRYPVARGLPGLEPHRGVAQPPTRTSSVLILLLVGGAALFPDRASPIWVAGAGAVALVGVRAVGWLLRIRHGRADGARRVGAAQAALDTVRPEVVLYSGDEPRSVHEVASWLPVLEQLNVPAMVLARHRGTFDALPETCLPVLCMPGTVDFQVLRWSSARVFLFTSNIANNIHALRIRGVRTAFIGHGDSDKGASSNPFSKVYDEIWVAGPAGRDRCLTADVGIRPESIVEVGRPQLALVTRGPRPRAAVPTVLYAPTWEGWEDESDHSSIVSHGERLVREVLAHPKPVRLLYRPHPYTGRRSRAAAAAHRRIVALLRERNAALGLAAPVVAARGAATGPARSATARLQLDIIDGEARVAAMPPSAHLVVEPGGVPLVSCLNACDGLITDVSSVLSDHLASDKPLAICDNRSLGADLFVSRYPSAAAGPIIPPDLAGLRHFLRVVGGAADDDYDRSRAAVRRQVLGPESPAGLERFARAVTDLERRSVGALTTSIHPFLVPPGGDPCVQ
jgi:hypothetical protein